MNRFVSRFFSIVCAAVCVLALCDRAAAAAQPYRSSGTAQFVSATAFVGSGQATYLGRYSEVGSVSFTPTSNPAVLHVEGSAVYTAANGDELHADIAGELNGVTGAITATVNYVAGGTGRFAEASGSAILLGQLGAGGSISVKVSGTIDY